MVDDRTRKIRGMLTRKRRNSSGEVVQYSCAIGGAALALGVDGNVLFRKLGEVNIDGVKPIENAGVYGAWTIGEFVYRTNDTKKADISKAEIGLRILKTADQKTLDTVLEVPKKEYN